MGFITIKTLLLHSTVCPAMMICLGSVFDTYEGMSVALIAKTYRSQREVCTEYSYENTLLPNKFFQALSIDSIIDWVNVSINKDKSP